MPSSKAVARRRTRSRRPAPQQEESPLRFAPVSVEQVAGYVDILIGAYPMFMSDRERAVGGFQEVLKTGYPELIAGQGPDGRLIGVYALYEFVATILGRGIPASGIGMVGTAMDRKKSGVALSVVRDYVKRTRRRGMPLSFLYPFRHDFYANMGWSPVAQAQQYSLAPGALPLYPERRSVRAVRDPDWQGLDRIHRQFVGRQGGLGLSRHPVRWQWLLRQSPQVFLVGDKDRPEGYLLSKFSRVSEGDNFHYNLEVIETEWATPEAMRAILGFLSSQRDQIQDIILDWPKDQCLEPILQEPVRRGTAMLPNHYGHGPVVGQGIMLRLEDPESAFALRPYSGSGALALEVRTRDPLFDNRPVAFRGALRGSEASGVRPKQARLTTNLQTLAGLWAGSVRARDAVDLGLLELEPASAVPALDDLLRVPLPWVVERF